MTAVAIIWRELRLEARRHSLYWLRVLGAVVLLAIFVGMVDTHQGSITDLGARIFPPLHAVLFFMIWLFAPLIIADCLAKEKREETLGLLLLTRLTPSGLVAAKACVHAFRSALLVLATLPILCLPIILGGVSGTEAWLALWLDANALILALTAGLVASACVRRWASALVVAEILSMILCLAFCAGYTTAFLCWAAPGLSNLPSSLPSSIRQLAFSIIQTAADFQGTWGQLLAAAPAGAEEVWLKLLYVLTNLSLLIGVLAWLGAAHQLRHSVFEVPASVRRLEWQRRWLTPAIGRALWRRQRRRALARNPIAWLQVYSWRARAAKWGWCLFLAGAEWLLLNVCPREYWLLGQYLVGLALLLTIVFAGAASWRQERRAGVWELILITPLSPWQLAGGRVRGLYQQFLAALLVWLASLWIWAPPGAFDNGSFLLGLFGLGVFLVAPLVGQDSALNLRGLWPAWLATGMAVIFTPGILFLLSLQEGWPLLILVGLIHVGLAAICGFGLYQQFAERRFWRPPRPRRRGLRRHWVRYPTPFSPRLVR